MNYLKPIMTNPLYLQAYFLWKPYHKPVFTKPILYKNFHWVPRVPILIQNSFQVPFIRIFSAFPYTLRLLIFFQKNVPIKSKYVSLQMM